MSRAHRAAQRALDFAVTVLVFAGAVGFPEDVRRGRYHARVVFPTAPSTSTVGGTVTTSERDPRQAQHIRAASDLLRQLGREIPPWRPGIIDGCAVLVDESSGNVIAELRGEWTPNLIRFFDHVNGTLLCMLAELIWDVSRGDLRPAMSEAESVTRWLGFGPNGRQPRAWSFADLSHVSAPEGVDDECE